MHTTNAAAYQLMRFNILNSKSSNSNITEAYQYAWDHGIFPAFDEEIEYHQPFAQQFRVSKNEVLELGAFLDEKWLAESPITFYELEDHYGVKYSTHTMWDRVKLLNVCRYMYLKHMFDDVFWANLIKNGNCPGEAESICY